MPIIKNDTAKIRERNMRFILTKKGSDVKADPFSSILFLESLQNFLLLFLDFLLQAPSREIILLHIHQHELRD